MKYDSPFEVMQKLSPVSYRLRMLASYGIHLVLNIAHLEKCQETFREFQNSVKYYEDTLARMS